jgi:aspartate/methionine/tyrosine aminotransferase
MMSLSRRLELLDWAHRNAAWVIEDDYDGEFGYQTAPLPALKSLDIHDRVIYCGSFNKTLFSGLRVGFMVVGTRTCATGRFQPVVTLRDFSSTATCYAEPNGQIRRGAGSGAVE